MIDDRNYLEDCVIELRRLEAAPNIHVNKPTNLARASENCYKLIRITSVYKKIKYILICICIENLKSINFLCNSLTWGSRCLERLLTLYVVL